MATIGEIAQRVAAYYRAHENQWRYSLASDRMNPEITGTSNCSALIWWVSHVCATGCDLDQLGHGYTGTFHERGQLVQAGVRGQYPDRSLLRPLDLFQVDRGIFTADFDHVELWLGEYGDGSELWGAGSAPLPHRSARLEAWCDAWDRWEIRRFSWGADEEGEYVSPETEQMIRDARDALCEPADASGRRKYAAMADRLAWMAAKQEAMQASIDRIAETLDALAKRG